jgi:hypothetical protein
MGSDDVWLPLRQRASTTIVADEVGLDSEPCLRDELGAPLLLDDLPSPGDLLI